ncbi:hypothetical protein [Flavobacterium sp.]|jgi:hypothetical protein|uniref:hypothetical protein n=1 Tax=Flavobacterium sp. TaxID=239 RepID=UPI0037C123A0
MSSCVSLIPLKQEFYNNKKVGIILQVDSIGMAKAGGQGLLDMALTPGNRFTEPLKKVEPKFNVKETLKAEITSILKEKNKDFVFIEQRLDYKNMIQFNKPNSDKKYSKKDFRDLKAALNVDEVMYINVKYGLLVSYYGLIELEKDGYVNVVTETVDLSDNSLLQQDNFQTVAKMDGNWKKGEDYENLRNAIQGAINNAATAIRTRF